MLGFTSHMMCRPRSLAPAGPSAAARPAAASAARAQVGARAVARPHLPAARRHLPAAAARPGRTVVAGTAASRLSNALRDVPMLDATVKGGPESSLLVATVQRGNSWVCSYQFWI